VELLMAMEEGEARIVGDEVDLGFLVSAQHYDILHNPGSLPARETCQLEAVPMQVNWMNVVARVSHPDPVAFPLLQSL
jgi:hypothetical protein